MKTFINNTLHFLKDTENFVSRAALVISWTSFSQIVMLLGIPFISRIYSPKIFGIYAIYSAIIYILNGVTALGTELLIPNPKQEKEGGYLFWAAIINVLLVNILLMLVLWLGYSLHFFQWVNLEAIMPYWWLIPFGGLCIGLRNCMLYWLIRQKRSHAVGIARFIQAPAIILVQVLVGYFYPQPSVLIIGGVFSWLVSDLYLARKVNWKQDNLLKLFSLNVYFSLMKKNKGFIVNSSFSLLVLGVSNYLPILLFAMNFDPVIAAWYAMAYQVFSPFDLISNAIIQLYVGEGNQIVQRDPCHLKTFYIKMLKGLGLLTFFPILLLATLGGPIFNFVFGSHWYQAGIYAQIMAFAMMMRFVALATSQNLAILKKQGITFLWSLLYITLMIGAFMPAHFSQVFATPELTIVTLAVAMFVAYLVLILLNFIGISRYAAANSHHPKVLSKKMTA